MTPEELTALLRRAYELGKIYWQQADSESIRLQNLSDKTQEAFDLLCLEATEVLERDTPPWK
jgi:hypothetical protein